MFTLQGLSFMLTANAYICAIKRNLNKKLILENPCCCVILCRSGVFIVKQLSVSMRPWAICRTFPPKGGIPQPPHTAMQGDPNRTKKTESQLCKRSAKTYAYCQQQYFNLALGQNINNSNSNLQSSPSTTHCKRAVVILSSLYQSLYLYLILQQ